jgi:hypothetical protein
MRQPEEGASQGRRVTSTRAPPKQSVPPPVGGVAGPWPTWAWSTDASTNPVWRGRRAVGERLGAHPCERGGSPAHLEGPQVRTRAELEAKARPTPPTGPRRLADRWPASVPGDQSYGLASLRAEPCRVCAEYRSPL